MRSKVVYGFGGGIFQPFVLFEAQIARCAEVVHFLLIDTYFSAVQGFAIGVEMDNSLGFSVCDNFVYRVEKVVVFDLGHGKGFWG